MRAIVKFYCKFIRSQFKWVREENAVKFHRESIRLHQLKWPVREEIGAAPGFQVVSFPHRREHIIYRPAPDSPARPPRQIEYLRELVCALLCEQMHHQFSSNLFKPGTPMKEASSVGWACRAAADWFVDARLMCLVPNQAKARIKKHLRLIRRDVRAGEHLNDEFLLLSAGLIIAQAIKYLGIKFRADKANGNLKRVIDIFLAVPEIEGAPGKKTSRGRKLFGNWRWEFERLINNLLFVYTDKRVRLVDDGNDLEVWEVVDIWGRDYFTGKVV